MGGAITFDASTYVVGNTATINWAYDPNIVNIVGNVIGLLNFHVNLVDSKGNIIQEWDDLVPNGTLTYTWQKTGVYSASLIESCFLCTDSTLGTATATVTQTAGQPTSNSLNTTKTQYNTTELVYIYGTFYPKSNEQTTGYVTLTLGGTGNVINTFAIDTSLSNSFNFTTNLGVGTYTAQLSGYLNTNDCAGTSGYPICFTNYNYKVFTVVNTSAGLSLSFFPSPGFLNTVESFTWTNVTANDTVKIYDNLGNIRLNYNVNGSNFGCNLCSNTLSFNIPDDVKYIGTWYGIITNGSNSSNFIQTNLTVISKSSVNFTNSYGITMYWNKQTGTINEIETVTWTTGTYIGSYQVKIINGVTGIVLTTLPFNSAGTETQTATWSFATSGVYSAQFLDNTSNISASANIKITTGTAATTPIGGGGAGGNLNPESPQFTGTLLLNVLSNIAFYGFVIWLGIISGTIGLMVRYGSQVSGTGIIFVGWIAAIFISLIGLFGEFKIYIIVISTIIAALMFYTGRKTTVEGQ